MSSYPSFPARVAVLVYGVVSYAIFFATFLYAIGFVGGFLVPRSIDSTPTHSLGLALLINCLASSRFSTA